MCWTTWRKPIGVGRKKSPLLSAIANEFLLVAFVCREQCHRAYWPYPRKKNETLRRCGTLGWHASSMWLLRGRALADIPVALVWQPWHLLTSIVLPCGRGDAYCTGLGYVATGEQHMYFQGALSEPDPEALVQRVKMWPEHTLLQKVSCNSASDRQACRTCNMFVAWPGLSRKACLRMYYFWSRRCCLYAPLLATSHTRHSHTPFFARSSSMYISAARNPFMDASSKYISFTHTHSHLLLMAHLSHRPLPPSVLKRKIFLVTHPFHMQHFGAHFFFKRCRRLLHTTLSHIALHFHIQLFAIIGVAPSPLYFPPSQYRFNHNLFFIGRKWFVGLSSPLTGCWLWVVRSSCCCCRCCRCRRLILLLLPCCCVVVVVAAVVVVVVVVAAVVAVAVGVVADVVVVVVVAVVVAALKFDENWPQTCFQRPSDVFNQQPKILTSIKRPRNKECTVKNGNLETRQAIVQNPAKPGRTRHNDMFFLNIVATEISIGFKQ